jgi:hypothetical protein
MTPFIGVAYSNVHVIRMRSNWQDSRACIPTWLPVALVEDDGSLHFISIVLLHVELCYLLVLVTKHFCKVLKTRVF